VVRKALYGRMRLGRCVRRDYGRPHCYDFLLVFCSWSNLGPLWNRLGAISSAIRQKRDLKEDEARSVVVAFRSSRFGNATRASGQVGATTVIWGPIYKISYDNLTIILR